MKFHHQSIKNDRVTVPCRINCPAYVDVPVYIRAIQKGNLKDAVATIMEKVPFPATLGRVCIRPCEDACRRGDTDEPVSICRLKRFAADGEYQCRPLPLKNTGKKVAIIGSGPAGLTAAYYLRLLGHDVTVYESLEEPGGMLRVGIPAYRLPRDVLKREIDRIVSLGVKIITNACIDNPGQMVEQDFNAVFIATGAHRGVSLGIAGEHSPCVLQGINYLREVNLGRSMPLGDKVAVIGGGHVAVDVARTAIRLGSASVTVFYHRTKNEMTAFRESMEQAEREGVTFEYLFNPKKIIAKTPLEVCFARMEPGEPDSAGRQQPIEISGIEVTRYFDSVVVAVGQRPSIPGFESTQPGGANSRLCVDKETMSTGIPGIYAGGDIVTGPSSVIEAAAAGRRAADAISRFIGGVGLDQIFNVRKKPCACLEKKDDFTVLARATEDIREIKIKRTGFSIELLDVNFDEVNLGIGVDQAVLEASRCLQCDLRMQLQSPVMPQANCLHLRHD